MRKCNCEDVLVRLGEVDVDVVLDDLRQIVVVLPVVSRQHHRVHAGPLGGDHLLLDAAHRQNFASQTGKCGNFGRAAELASTLGGLWKLKESEFT